MQCAPHKNRPEGEIMIKAYVINLDRSPDRYKQCQQSFLHYPLELTRVSAVDGADMDICQEDLDKLRPLHGRPFQAGELGCYHSHLKALKQFVASQEAFAIVLEDDACATINLRQLPELIRMISGEDFGASCIINLANPPRKYFKRLCGIETGVPIVRTFRFPISGMGILWSKFAASEFLRLHSEPILPVDCAFRELNRTHKNGYGVMERFIQGSPGLQSEIGEFGNRNRRSITQGWRLKAWRFKHDLEAGRQYLFG